MNAANAQIGDWLGLQLPATEGEILRIVEGRLAPPVIKTPERPGPGTVRN